MDPRTDQRTDGPTDGRTHPLIESWLTTKKCIPIQILFERIDSPERVLMSMITVIVVVDVVVGVAANSTMQGQHFCLMLFFIENGDRQTRRSIAVLVER